MAPPRGVSWWRWPGASDCRYIISGSAKARTICSPLWQGISRTHWWGQRADESADPPHGTGPWAIADIFRGFQVFGHLRRNGGLHGRDTDGLGDRLLDREKIFAHAAFHRGACRGLRRTDALSQE